MQPGFRNAPASQPPARRIIDGAKQITLFGEAIPVRVQTQIVSGFSGHADQQALLAWHRAVAGMRTTFPVHGEATAMARFADLPPEDRVEMPEPHQEFTL